MNDRDEPPVYYTLLFALAFALVGGMSSYYLITLFAGRHQTQLNHFGKDTSGAEIQSAFVIYLLILVVGHRIGKSAIPSRHFVPVYWITTLALLLPGYALALWFS